MIVSVSVGETHSIPTAQQPHHVHSSCVHIVCQLFNDNFLIVFSDLFFFYSRFCSAVLLQRPTSGVWTLRFPLELLLSGFIDFIVVPTFTVLTDMMERIVTPLIDEASHSGFAGFRRSRWEQAAVLEAKRFICDDAPQSGMTKQVGQGENEEIWIMEEGFCPLYAA